MIPDREHADTEQGPDLLNKCRSRRLECSGNPELLALVVSEPLGVGQAEQPCQHGVVSNFRMDIEWNVRRVQR